MCLSWCRVTQLQSPPIRLPHEATASGTIGGPHLTVLGQTDLEANSDFEGARRGTICGQYFSGSKSQVTIRNRSLRGVPGWGPLTGWVLTSHLAEVHRSGYE